MVTSKSSFRIVVHYSSGEVKGLEFWHPTFPRPRVARMARFSPNNSTISLSRSRAVEALIALLEGTVKYRNSGSDQPYKLVGGRGSLAASLDYALDKKPIWIREIFSRQVEGKSLISGIFERDNPRLRRGGNVAVWIKSASLQIEIVNEGSVAKPSKPLRTDSFHDVAFQPLIGATISDQISLHYANARAATVEGDTSRALTEMEHCFSLATSVEEKRRFVGQLINIEYCAVTSFGVNKLGHLFERHHMVQEVLEDLGIPCCLQYISSTRFNHTLKTKVISGDPENNLYLLMWDSILNIIKENDATRRLALLHFQRRAIISLLNYNPKVAWNRFSPLISLALRYNEINFAAETWSVANKFGSFEGIAPKGVREYVQEQRRNQGVEWRIHEYLGFAVSMRMGKKSEALQKWESFMIGLPLVLEPYFENMVLRISGMRDEIDRCPNFELKSHALYFECLA